MNLIKKKNEGFVSLIKNNLKLVFGLMQISSL